MTEQTTPSRKISRTAQAVFWAGVGLFAASLIFAAFVKTGSAVPDDFSLPSLDGGTIHLADTRGKTVVLNFWASWCVPCAAEMPEVESFYRAHKDANVVVIGINVGETEETARAFVEEMDVTFPIALDEDTEVATQYGMRGLPMTIVLDRWGLIRWNRLGQLDRDLLEAHLP